MSSPTFSAATYNVLADAYIKPGRYPNCDPADLEPRRRRALLLDTVEGLGADLLCLQEVEPSAFADLSRRLAATHAGVHAVKPGKDEGLAIFAHTSFTIEGHTTLQYEAQGSGQQALVATLRHGAKRLALACTHLKWQPRSTAPSEHVGRLQLMELLGRRGALAPGVAPWIIAGDFNAGIQSDVLNAALADGTLDISCRAQRPWDTTNINGRRRKLDFLLHTPAQLSPDPRPLGIRLERSTPMPSARFASDHLPVVVDFAWR